MRNARLEEAQARIKITGRNINNIRYADDTTLMAESEELKTLLLKIKKESGNFGLKLTFRKLRSWHLVPSLHGTWMGKHWKQWLQNYCRSWLQPWNYQTLTPWKKSYDQPRQHIKKQTHYFANKVPPSQGYGFSSGHVWMWELDYKERWAIKNWCFWTVVLE